MKGDWEACHVTMYSYGLRKLQCTDQELQAAVGNLVMRCRFRPSVAEIKEELDRATQMTRAQGNRQIALPTEDSLADPQKDYSVDAFRNQVPADLRAECKTPRQAWNVSNCRSMKARIESLIARNAPSL